MKPRDARSLIQKADMALADLTTDGGVLLPEQAKKFIIKLIKRSVIMKAATVIPMAGPKRRIEKLGFTERILRAGTSGSELGDSDRVKPALSKQELSTKLVKAECWIPDEVLEDNIEKAALQRTIINEMSRRVPLDLDELFLLGDVDSQDTFLALLDGFIKSATSNVYAAGGVLASKAVWKGMWKTMPQQYRELKSNMVIYTSSDAQAEYADQIGERGTPAGDKAAIDGMAPKWQGIPVEEIPVMPQDLGVGGNETDALLTNPKNMTIGVQRQIRVRWDTDIRKGIVFIVIDLRMDAQWAEEEAAVKATGILYE